MQIIWFFDSIVLAFEKDNIIFGEFKVSGIVSILRRLRRDNSTFSHKKSKIQVDIFKILWYNRSVTRLWVRYRLIVILIITTSLVARSLFLFFLIWKIKFIIFNILSNNLSIIITPLLPLVMVNRSNEPTLSSHAL